MALFSNLKAKQLAEADDDEDVNAGLDWEDRCALAVMWTQER
jgi:hypothetical protein